MRVFIVVGVLSADDSVGDGLPPALRGAGTLAGTRVLSRVAGSEERGGFTCGPADRRRHRSGASLRPPASTQGDLDPEGDQQAAEQLVHHPWALARPRRTTALWISTTSSGHQRRRGRR